MKSTIKWLGIVALATVIGFSMTACNSSRSKAGSALKEYEVFLNSFESLVKKVKAGDTSSYAEMEKLAVSVGEWAERLEGFSESDLSLAQKAKLATLYVRTAAVMADFALYQYRQ